MDEAIKATILRNFTAVQSAIADGSRPSEWQWAEDLIIFPEARCAFCHSAMQSNRIWLVQGRQLLKRWKFADGQVIEETAANADMHPQANGTTICTGSDGASVQQALFLGMNFDSNYWSNDKLRWKAWMLNVFNHECPPSYANGCRMEQREQTPDTCTCEGHRMARGEAVRCLQCGEVLAVDAVEAHRPRCICACACRCAPTRSELIGGCYCMHAECNCEPTLRERRRAEARAERRRARGLPALDHCTNSCCTNCCNRRCDFCRAQA